MIHYHGTPIGGTIDEVQRFLPGRHCLVSFHHADQINYVSQLCQSFVLDNGAFSFWKTGKDVDFSGYHAWVQGFAGHPSLDWAIIPDKIDGTEDENSELITKWLREGSSVESVPVYHLHESLDYLSFLVDKFRTVALGSSGEFSTPNTYVWWQRMAQVMDVATNSIGRPKSRLHGLRMLDPDVFQRLPLASADSTNAAVNSGAVNRFGSYIPPARSLRAAVIADRIEQYNSADRWQYQHQNLLELG